MWSHVVIIIVYSDGEVGLLMVSERAPGASEMGGYTFRQAVISTVSKCFFLMLFLSKLFKFTKISAAIKNF